MHSPSFISVARIIKTHGVKGEISVRPDMALSLDFLLEIPIRILPPRVNSDELRVTGIRPGPKGPLLKLSGIDSIDIASQLRGLQIAVRESDLPDEWTQTEFDPLGSVIIDEVRGELGTVKEVIITGANDVWVVASEETEVLIPVIDEVVLQIDEENAVIQVKLLPGLIEE